MFEAFVAALSLIGVSEIGDRTQVASMLLGARYHKSHGHVFAGVMAGFAFCFLVAVTLGSAIIAYFSPGAVRTFSALIFVGMGVLTLLGKDDENVKVKDSKGPFLASFTLIAFSETGDKTQVAAMLLAASMRDPAGTFAGSMLAIALLSGAAIFAGKEAAKRISMKWVRHASGVLFILFGAGSILL